MREVRRHDPHVIDRLAYVRGHQLRDLVERLDYAFEVLTPCDCNEDGAVLVEQHDRFNIESTLEATAVFLHELRLREMTASRMKEAGR